MDQKGTNEPTRNWRPLSGPFEIQLGQTVRDRLSGLVGTAASRIEYLTGCTQVGVAPAGLKDDGDTKDWRYFDWQRLEVDANAPNQWADVLASEATTQRNGAGEPPRGKY